MCNEIANFKYSSGSPRTVRIMSSTYLLKNFILSNCPSVCRLLQYVPIQAASCILAYSSFVIFWNLAWNQFLHNSHSTPFPPKVNIRFQFLHFSFWSDLEIFQLSSGFCSDASNDFIQTLISSASITASDAPIARPSDSTYQVPLHLKQTIFSASPNNFFVANLGISRFRLLKLISFRANFIASPTSTLVYKREEKLSARYLQERVILRLF